MSAHGRSPDAFIEQTHNAARFFTENRQVSWVLLFGVLLWGVFGYIKMPKRKDPALPVLYAAAICPWPGASAERVEQLVTRKIDEKMAENARVQRIESTSRRSVSIVVIMLDERIPAGETEREYNDIGMRLNTISDLPPGAGPIQFMKDFGDTAALMLTVTSPKVDAVELSLRARAVRAAIQDVRARVPASRARGTVIVAYPPAIDATIPKRDRDLVLRYMQQQRFGGELLPVDGSGFVGIDLDAPGSDDSILAFLQQAIDSRLVPNDFHPDVWRPVVVRNPEDAAARLATVAGDKYTYRQLDDYTDLIKRVIQTVPQVSKVTRAGLLPEEIYLEYSQERLGATGFDVGKLGQILAARNVIRPGGVIEADGKSIGIDASGEFKDERDLGDVIVGASSANHPLYLRDGLDVFRGYESSRYLNFYDAKDASGAWQRSRAITLAIQMRPGEQISAFGAAVNAALESARVGLPPDLIIARPSDQALQVSENIGLFMRSLWEAIVLVVLVALLGFWEWRSALLMAVAIPLTLAMTFGFMYLLNIDLQQVSIASLIIALGLLVDDPVVAGDAIRRTLEAGQPPIVAAWLGPTRLARAILFATITNIVAYLPLLMMQGTTGDFIYSLPIVLACSLVASRITSMTFVPLLGYYLLRPGRRPERTIAERRSRGFTGAYYRVGSWAIEHRWGALGIAVVILSVGGWLVLPLSMQFFPKDLSYLSYVDVWLPEDATVTATNATAERAERIIRATAAAFGRDILKSVTTFVGGGGPRFWFSVAPELVQPNYAQLIINVNDKHETAALVPVLQQALSAGVPGARVDVRQLETGKSVGIPVSVRLSGDDIVVLRRLSAEAQAIFRSVPTAARVRDDWGADSFTVDLKVDPDRANLAGVSNLEAAEASGAAVNGVPLTTLREGDRQIPIVARLRPEERARLSDLQNLYVYSLQSTRRVPIGQISTIGYGMTTEKIRRRNQFRTITVSAFPVPGALPSQVLGAMRQRLNAFARALPPGYKMEIGGEEEEQVKGFTQITVVMAVSVCAIFLALVLQFRSAIKPLIVFAAIPFGVIGALIGLSIMGAPFGFMAFLGVASLIGVIVSHVIVLFDFIEEMHERHAPLREALLDAGIVRLRPVLITVGATVFGLIPLALHGGPLWEGLCYTQIGGLTAATAVTLLLVPVLYAICVLDLRILKWEEIGEPEATA